MATVTVEQYNREGIVTEVKAIDFCSKQAAEHFMEHTIDRVCMINSMSGKKMILRRITDRTLVFDIYSEFVLTKPIGQIVYRRMYE